MAMLRRHWWIVALFSVVGVVSGLFLLGILPLPGRGSTTQATESAAEARAAKVVNVTVEPVVVRTVQRRVALIGSLYGEEEIPLATEIDGTVKTIYHGIGDRVKPGTVLLELDDRDYKRAVEEAQAMLDVELTRLGVTQVPGRDFDILLLPSVKRALAQEKFASIRRERAKKLGSAAAEEERDQTEADYQVAAASVLLAKFEARATLAQAVHRQTQLLQAQERLAKCKIIAPTPTGRLAGRPLDQIHYAIADRMVSEGQPVRMAEAASKPAFRLVIDDSLKLYGLLPERYAGQIAVKQPVDLEVEAHPDEVFKGVVTRVNPTIDRSNRTFAVEIGIDNATHRLAAGSFVKASILTNRVDQARTVPEEALVTYAGVTKVFVLDGDKVHEVQVRPGVRVEQRSKAGTRYWVEVTGKIEPEQRIVTSGMSQLVDGSTVRLRTP